MKYLIAKLLFGCTKIVHRRWLNHGHSLIIKRKHLIDIITL